MDTLLSRITIDPVNCLGSTTVDPGTVGEAYRHLYVCYTKVPDCTVTITEVKLVPPFNPIAKAGIAERDRRRGRVPVRLRGGRLGNIPIAEAYTYPKIGPMTRDDIRQTVMAIMSDSGNLQPSTFTLADGSTRLAIPIGRSHPAVPGWSEGSCRAYRRRAQQSPAP